MRLGFIGTGNMAGAIIKGIIAGGQTAPEEIYCYSPTREKLLAFTAETGTVACESNEALIRKVDVVVLGVKPNVLPELLPQLQEAIHAHNVLVISLAAGTAIAKLEQLLKAEEKLSIIRVMPNVNAMIGAGVAAVCGNRKVTEEQLAYALGMFEAVGMAVELPEKDFSTFIGIAGSAPAYAYLFIDSLARGAVKNGMPKKLATKLAAGAVLGSAKMILESDENPWELIDKVCSPGGTTIAGLMALEDEKFISTVVKCVDTTVAKDKLMMKE